jgi:DNA-binding GntR family transcriptional regulator
MTAAVAGSMSRPGSLTMPAPPAHTKIAGHYRARILSGELPPGTQLPTQREIAAEWHCSVQPVKAALLRLELEGLVESRQGVGAFVTAKK